MTRNSSNPSLLAQIFAAEGNPLHATASGFRTGHEPVHASTSGTCVNLPMDQNHWHCFNCQQGGGPVEAIMSLKGVSRNEAEAHLRALSGEPGAGEEDARGKLSQATMLVRLVEGAVELFHDPVLKTYGRVLIGDHREVCPTRSTAFRRWLIWKYYQANGAVPNADAVNMAAHTLEAIAQFDGPCRLVHVRVAADGGSGVYIDLGDATWRAIHITPGAWQVVEQPDVMFLHSPGMRPLPEPVRGGTLETLRGLMNLPQDSDHAWALIKAWLVAALTPRGPYPLLALRGEQGTAKSTQAKFLRALIDPATPELRSDPRELRDLAIAARSCWLLGFDNISHIQPWLSDALCRLATGGGWATRELYTDHDEVLFEARRPVLLNGITNYITAPDLLDRAIQIELPPIPKGRRRPERRGHPDDPPGVLDEFEEHRPMVLGALVDLVAGALQGLPGVYLENLQRMADFTMLGLAAEKATSKRPWSLNTSIFLQAYDHSITEAHEHAIDGSPIGPALLAVLETGAWSGSYTELLEQLQIQGGDRVSRSKNWPKTPRGLSGEISRLAPALRVRGYEVNTGARDPNTRRSLVTIQREITSPPAEETPAAPSASSDTTLPPNNEDGCLGDQLHPSSEACPTSFIISAAEDRLPILNDLGNDSSSDLPDKTAKMDSCQEESEEPDDDAGLLSGHSTVAPNDWAEGQSSQTTAITAESSNQFTHEVSHLGSAGDTSSAESSERFTAVVEVGASFELPPIEYIEHRSHLEAVFPDLLQAPMLGMDTETTGLDPLTAKLRVIQLATERRIYVIDAYTSPVTLLAPIFNADRLIIGHNLKFDLKMLAAAGLPWPTGPIFDTMLAAQLLGAGTPEGQLSQSGLAAVVERYLHFQVAKTEQRSDWSGSLSPQQLHYAAVDAGVLWPLSQALITALQAADLVRVMDIENACVPALAWLELTGLPVNDQQWQERAKTERHRKEALAAQLNVMVGGVSPNGERPYKAEHSVNWNSAKQVLQVLQARGLAVKQTDSETLSEVADQDPLVPLLLQYREAAKRSGSFGETWLEKHRHPVSGRIHADYLQLGSVAGRMSCTRPNVQQMPRSAAYRGAIQAPEERVIIKADYSQIELRLAAVIAPDEALLTAFHAGADVHVRTAAMILGLEPAQVTPEQRQLAKALNFGLLYGMREEMLRAYAASQYGVPLGPIAAVQYRDRFFKNYEGLQQWHRKTARACPYGGSCETRTLAGRRRLGVTSVTEALNSPVQGSGADGLKLALGRLFRIARRSLKPGWSRPYTMKS